MNIPTGVTFHDPQVAARQADEDLRLGEVLKEERLLTLRKNLKDFDHDCNNFVADSHCRSCWMIDHTSYKDLLEMELAILGE